MERPWFKWWGMGTLAQGLHLILMNANKAKIYTGEIDQSFISKIPPLASCVYSSDQHNG